MAGALAFLMLGAQAPQQSIPDAPKPQIQPPAFGSVTPGKGSGVSSSGDVAQPAADDADAPGATLPGQKSPPPPASNDSDMTPPEQGVDAFRLVVRSDFVEVPFTVKDNKNRLVPGITWRDVQVFENGYRQHISTFTADPFPLSVALVIDQSLTFDTMSKVNNALGALQGAFAPYDEVAVFTYNNGPKMQTDFTAAQGARLSAVLERSKTTGREALMPMGGPLDNNVNVNNGAQSYIDPNVNNSHGTQPFNNVNPPRELHTLNDAILAAGVSLSKAAPGRRRIIYVISDGKEYGSKAKRKDVVKVLQTNKISVWATLVGDSSITGMGFVDRVHLPLTMRDNILPLYTSATGGQTDPEFRIKGIETSFAKITEEVRTQYTVGYLSHEPFIDGKYRTIELKVMKPNLSVIAKPGYWPLASDAQKMTAKPVSATP
jgi:VWFA-related protein